MTAGTIIRVSSVSHWLIYVLEQGGGFEFYVGLTQNMLRRAYQHAQVPGRVRSRIQAIEAAGGFVQMRIIAQCFSEDEARWREAAEMRQRPGLLNQSGYGINQARYAAAQAQRLLAPVARVIDKRGLK